MLELREVCKRRVVRQHSSNIVALPKFWLRMQGVEAGDELSFLVTKDGLLVLKPSKARKGVDSMEEGVESNKNKMGSASP